MNSPWSTLNIICFHVHFSKLSTLPYFAICIHLRFSTATCTGKVQISLLATAHDLASWPFAVYRRVPTVPLLPSVPSHPSFHGAHFFSNVGGLARLLKICVHRREGAAGIALALLLKLEGVGSIFTIVTLVSNNPKRDILTRRLAALESRVLGKMWNGTEHMDLSDEKVHQNLTVYIGSSSSKWSSPWYHQFLDTSYRQFFHYSDSFHFFSTALLGPRSPCVLRCVLRFAVCSLSTRTLTPRTGSVAAEHQPIQGKILSFLFCF